jgi:nitroreductase
MNIKESLKRARARVNLYCEALKDARRYAISAGCYGKNARHPMAQLEASIIKTYHVLEKGLSMQEFRARFGSALIVQLQKLLANWKNSSGDPDNIQVRSAYAVLQSYRKRHENLGVDISDLFDRGIIDELNQSESGIDGGVINPPAVSSSDCEALNRIFATRRSMRSFRTDLIPEYALILNAINTARRTPSVCNRQTWRVHVYRNDKAQALLGLQNGNRGFGHSIPILLVVCSDLRFFGGVSERYQGWIDGGMFSMSLLLALHARGVESVALNWSVLNSADVGLRNAGDIPDYERIIMLIGCGYASGDALVTCSQRYPVEKICKLHD